MAQDKPVTLAAVAGAHGVTGEVRLKLFGEGIASLKQHKAFNAAGSGAALTLKKVRDDGKGGAIARFDEVLDRNGAEALRGTQLTVSRSALPPLGPGEYYYADLLGLAAQTPSGELLGTVIAVENYGAGDVIEVERVSDEAKPGKRFLVPMRPEAVPSWDETRLVIHPDYVES